MTSPGVRDGAQGGRIVTAMTYNVRVGLGDENQGWYVLPDGHLGNLPQCARVIREVKPDWVAIEEIDRGTDRTGKVDQTDALAKLTGMHGVFRGKIPVDSGDRPAPGRFDDIVIADVFAGKALPPPEVDCPWRRGRIASRVDGCGWEWGLWECTVGRTEGENVSLSNV